MPSYEIVLRMTAQTEFTVYHIMLSLGEIKALPSLNDCLHIGPSLHRKILDKLIRFWLFPIAIVADIENAFPMIRIVESDEDSLRFLWFKDVWADLPEIQVFKFTSYFCGHT
uniref:Uncharacterized protein n=1 Tax=Amphimedon queenslandica TaxID=400682 RepID=A0A1X7VE69_AMPQE